MGSWLEHRRARPVGSSWRSSVSFSSLSLCREQHLATLAIIASARSTLSIAIQSNGTTGYRPHSRSQPEQNGRQSLRPLAYVNAVLSPCSYRFLRPILRGRVFNVMKLELAPAGEAPQDVGPLHHQKKLREVA